MRNLLLRLIIASLCLLSVGACTTIVDATTSGPIEPDPGKRSFGDFLDDEQMETIVAVNLRKIAPGLAQSHINVFSFNGVILLTGEVPSKELRELAGKTARDIRGARQVHNELQIQSNSTFFSRTNDNWLHTKVRTRLLSNDDIESERVKIIVENRTVYIMGLLTPKEGEIATSVVASTSGVKRVVRAIEFIEDKQSTAATYD